MAFSFLLSYLIWIFFDFFCHLKSLPPQGSAWLLLVAQGQCIVGLVPLLVQWSQWFQWPQYSSLLGSWCRLGCCWMHCRPLQYPCFVHTTLQAPGKVAHTQTQGTVLFSASLYVDCVCAAGSILVLAAGCPSFFFFFFWLFGVGCSLALGFATPMPDTHGLALAGKRGRPFLILGKEGLISTCKETLPVWRQVTGFILLCLKVASNNTGGEIVLCINFREKITIA